jgi:hypothetical protein
MRRARGHHDSGNADTTLEYFPALGARGRYTAAEGAKDSPTKDEANTKRKERTGKADTEKQRRWLYHTYSTTCFDFGCVSSSLFVVLPRHLEFGRAISSPCDRAIP